MPTSRSDDKRSNSEPVHKDCGPEVSEMSGQDAHDGRYDRDGEADEVVEQIGGGVRAWNSGM